MQNYDLKQLFDTSNVKVGNRNRGGENYSEN